MAGNSAGLCAWCFDLLAIDGKDVRKEPLEQRRHRLLHLLSGADQDLLRFSEGFDDADKLLAATARMGLEGIVSKKRSSTLRRGAELRLGEDQDAALTSSEPRALQDV